MSRNVKKSEPQNYSLAREKNTKDGLTLIKLRTTNTRVVTGGHSHMKRTRVFGGIFLKNL